MYIAMEGSLPSEQCGQRALIACVAMWILAPLNLPFQCTAVLPSLLGLSLIVPRTQSVYQVTSWDCPWRTPSRLYAKNSELFTVSTNALALRRE